jgi:flagellar hook-associated protein 3 FlgL
MRVTEQMVVSNFLSNISKTRQSIDDLSQMIASNNTVSTVSDDPFASEAILRYQHALSKNQQYQENVADAITYLETSFDSTDGIISSLTDLKTTLTAAANTTDADELTTYGNEVESILQQLVDYGNTQSNNKYVFAGTNTTTIPYTYDGTTVTVSDAGTSGDVLVDIGGVNLETISTNGDDIFQGTDLFKYVEEVRDTLLSGSPPTNDQLAAVDDYIDNVSVQFGKIGAVTERFEAIQTQLGTEETRLTEYLGSEKDIDLPDTIIKLTQAQTNLQAAFQAWSSILQESLFNFLE